LKLIHQQPWKKEVSSPIIRKKLVATKWIPVPPEEWGVDYFEQQAAVLSSPFLRSVGVLPEPTPVPLQQQLPAQTESQITDRQRYMTPDEQDLSDDERAMRSNHRKLEHRALMPADVLRKEDEDEAAWQIRKARYEREGAEHLARREAAEREEETKRQEERRRLATSTNLLDAILGPGATDASDE
jgi:hypothetical protein